MTTTKQTCSTLVPDGGRSVSVRRCPKPVRVVRDGKPYCTIHDPEYIKARDAAKCWERVYGRMCGKPAVEVDENGFGRCAAHSLARFAAEDRLDQAAPALLAAAKALVDAHNAGIPLNRLNDGEDHRWKVARAAIALAEEVQP